MALALGLVQAGALGAQQPATGFLDRTVTVGGATYRYQVYVPSPYAADHAWPVILFLHGSGERGRDGLLQTNQGLGPIIRADASRYPAIVVFPQAPPDSLWNGMPAQAALAALDQTMAEFRTDSDRVYLTGLSMGGNGTWYLAYRNPDRFAAIVPICGWVTAAGVLPVSAVPLDSGVAFSGLAQRLRRVPTWIFHGEIDPWVPVDQSRRAADALRAAGGIVRYTELPGTEHIMWDAAYRSPAFVAWLFAQRRRR